MKHKHAELIKAWADGVEIEYNNGCGWFIAHLGDFDKTAWQFRIKPEPKIDIVQLKTLYKMGNDQILDIVGYFTLTYCGETGKLKSAEVI